jgi:hypothetical protein
MRNGQKENQERQHEAILKENRTLFDENKQMQTRIAELHTANVGLTHKTECMQRDSEYAARRHDEQVLSYVCYVSVCATWETEVP